MDQTTIPRPLLQTLPDPARQLSAQSIEPALDTFTCFPRLPPELRDRVYYHTLPGPRIINLIPAPLGKSDSFKPPPLPQALHICQESRQIALKNYHLIFYGPYKRQVSLPPQWSPTTGKITYPSPIDKVFGLVMAVDPVIDNIYIRYFNAAEHWNSDRPWERRQFWQHIREKHENLFRAVKSLEIKGVFWDVRGLKDAAYSWVVYPESPLEYFTGLEELHLTPIKSKQEDPEDDDTDYYDWPGAEDWEQCVGSFLLKFMKYAKKDSTRKIPQIYVHEWRESRVRTEEENREDGTIDYELTDESLRDAIGYKELFDDTPDVKR